MPMAAVLHVHAVEHVLVKWILQLIIGAESGLPSHLRVEITSIQLPLLRC